MEKRTFQIEVGNIRDADQRTVEAVLSTSHPVQRWDGLEVLSHEAEAIDLSRAPLPLITGHNERSLPVGVVEDLRIEGEKLKGVLRISKSQDRIWGDIQDKIIQNLSIGYFVKKKQRTAKGFLITRWQPYECSLVAAGADPAAGIGRSFTTRKGNTTMDLNDILKAKKRAVDELSELAQTENLDDAAQQRMSDLQTEIRSLDIRIEGLETAQRAKDDLNKHDAFKPKLDDKQDRNLIKFEGGPAEDRSFKGMFGDIQTDQAEIEKFQRAMIEGLPSAGGYSVPEPLAAKWLDESLPNEIIRSRATVWPMTSASRKVPGWDISDQSSGKYFGGFAMEFLAEEGTGTAQTGKLRMIELSAQKGAIFVDISNELREDGESFESQLEMAMKKSISLGMDHYFLRGTGAGQPLGVLEDPALISISAEVGQAADSIAYKNLAKMFARHYAPQRAVWITNASTLPQLLTLTIEIGTAGGHIKILNENNGSFSILGRPVLFSQSMPVLGDANDIVFADLSQYAIGLRKDLRLERSNIPGWTQDLMSYRAITRFDGQGTWNTYITPRNGDTLSWVVGLAERA